MHPRMRLMRLMHLLGLVWDEEVGVFELGTPNGHDGVDYVGLLN